MAEIISDDIELDTVIARKVLLHMYDESDQKKFNLSQQESFGLKYSTFIKMILDFQLAEHEKYLKGFNVLFQQVDTDNDGLIDLI